jgi:hypothetical protein
MAIDESMFFCGVRVGQSITSVRVGFTEKKAFNCATKIRNAKWLPSYERIA